MHLQVGNKVAVLDDVIRGVVIGISNDNISIEAEGMTFVFKASELVKIEAEQFELSKYSDINNQLLKEKNTPKKKKISVFKKNKNNTVMEVDLHIEKLLKNVRGMDNFDILNYQIKTATHKLEYCIQKRIPRLIFIHGVGEGVLKTELQYLLNKYPVRYQDASYREYGLGATEVVI